MKAAHTANEIASYLLWLNAREAPEDPDYLTNLKLQKLLYYIQGWHLAQTGQPAFAEEVQAWREGPVVPEVYQAYKNLGTHPIVDAPARQPRLTDDLRDIVEQVWERYKAFSGYELSDMTHSESPWRETRGDAPPSAPGAKRIPQESLAREFRAQAEQARRRLADHARQIRAASRSLTNRPATNS